MLERKRKCRRDMRLQVWLGDARAEQKAADIGRARLKLTRTTSSPGLMTINFAAATASAASASASAADGSTRDCADAEKEIGFVEIGERHGRGASARAAGDQTRSLDDSSTNNYETNGDVYGAKVASKKTGFVRRPPEQ